MTLARIVVMIILIVAVLAAGGYGARMLIDSRVEPEKVAPVSSIVVVTRPPCTGNVTRSPVPCVLHGPVCS